METIVPDASKRISTSAEKRRYSSQTAKGYIDCGATLHLDPVTRVLYASTRAGIAAGNTDSLCQEYLGEIKSLPIDRVSVSSNHDGTVTAISSLETVILDDYGMRRN